MRRRDFVRSGALGGAALLGGAPVGRLGENSDPVRRNKAATPNDAVFDLEEATIVQLQRDMTERKRTARSITEQYLDRIDSLDKRGPALHHVLETNPEALSIADALDRERASRGPRGSLHGIPILLKDTRCRRNSPRKNESQRVGKLSLDTFIEWMERTRWTRKESLRPRSKSMRVELGHRRRCFR